MSRHRVTTLALAAILSALPSACGGEPAAAGIEPLAADYVLSIFELEAKASGPCAALANLPGEGVGESGWELIFLTQEELLEVLDCRLEGEDVVHESAGRLLGGEQSHMGWAIFTRRTTLSGLDVAISGQGEGMLAVGLVDGERAVVIDLMIRHQSGRFFADGSLRYEGPWPAGRLMLLHRRVGESLSAPWVCVAIELH